MDEVFDEALRRILDRDAEALRLMSEWDPSVPAPYACSKPKCTELAGDDGLCEVHREQS